MADLITIFVTIIILGLSVVFFYTAIVLVRTQVVKFYLVAAAEFFTIVPAIVKQIITAEAIIETPITGTSIKDSAVAYFGLFP